MRFLVSPGAQTLTGEVWLLGTESEVLRERALHESELPQMSCNSRFGTDPAKTKILVLTSTDSCSETYPAVIEGKWLEITGVNSTNLGSVDGTRETVITEVSLRLAREFATKSGFTWIHGGYHDSKYHYSFARFHHRPQVAPVNSTRPKKLAAPEGHRQRSAPQRGFPRLSLAVRESLLLGGYRRVDADLNESG
ncbi:uncharacterized protein BO87DRAFT_425780 [Aspergillus neoniger CBS 115656]|uniref:Uncharacterized protein n=1 Tax=Aspergillus neoniger (strain CBS 115656) TaxID=1448310 RepID=A0A318YJJ9_ASPNB|nr:hypothetical protein BO87DRAFT_425780 [Aspergillus neoniger CBS 115656]PYH34536.1 hypothetical protein BO87DRAFT_425780 [Aspergillus neoniger CBS 115656]